MVKGFPMPGGSISTPLKTKQKKNEEELNNVYISCYPHQKFPISAILELWALKKAALWVSLWSTKVQLISYSLVAFCNALEL